MKRDVALVSYSSSEESESSPIPPKKRKLPALSVTLTGPVHVDDPVLHQGRIRSVPHIDGQFATHIYASVALDRSSAFFQLLCSILVSAKKAVPTLQDFWSSDSAQDRERRPELHISLSRPIYLRAHQRDDMKRAVKRITDTTAPFTASFARISELVNDERTRIFLVLEIGAGHHELTALVNSVTPALRAIRQQEYYTAPRFHASIGWALLGGRGPSHVPTNTTASIGMDSSNSATSPSETLYPKITEFPPALLPALNEEYGPRLKTAPTVKSFEIGQLCIRIGKEVSRLRLNGT
ncbi:hypothetical protein GGX14DRAFT_535988 [Mycena pura]|uniref:U6 snRNA phosphodiesterase 1 n=1 Tax=Mycena pura TaxID=153505 RepID=A0AAD6YCS7_9AGAR|nr:hypothetical protein GGX14DRAFT_535988 [Mycena pura]